MHLRDPSLADCVSANLILDPRTAGLRPQSPRAISSRMFRMFLADFDLGAPQQRHMETENRLQRSRVTETYTADGTRFRGVREADVTHYCPRAISSRMFRMFLADFDLGAPQQRHMETENRQEH